MAASEYQRFAYKLFRGMVAKSAEGNAQLRLALQRAHMEVRPEVYLATTYLNALVAVVATGFVIAVVLIATTAAGLPFDPLLLVVAVPLPLFAGIVMYSTGFLVPSLKASNRARDIDAKLPFALNYIATMAASGIPPDKVFEGLSRQPLYGEVSEEAAWITRDLQLLGMDIVTALAKAIDRSPSIRFQDLLQGAVTSITTGGDLKTYFLSKSEQFIEANRQQQVQFLESLGILAESFVTVVVAVPVLFIVLLTIMAAFGGGGASVLVVGYLLVLVLIPLAQLGFAATIKFITPEA